MKIYFCLVIEILVAEIIFVINFQDDSSCCSSALSVLGFGSIGEIVDNANNEVYLEDIEDENEEIEPVRQLGNVGGSQDKSPVRQYYIDHNVFLCSYCLVRPGNRKF